MNFKSIRSDSVSVDTGFVLEKLLAEAVEFSTLKEKGQCSPDKTSNRTFWLSPAVQCERTETTCTRHAI